MGNHDEAHELIRLFQKTLVIRRFDEFNFVCSHIPMHKTSCYSHRKDLTMVNVHGHVHENDVPECGYVNISCEKTGYAPIHIEDVKLLVNKELEKCLEKSSQS